MHARLLLCCTLLYCVSYLFIRSAGVLEVRLVLRLRLQHLDGLRQIARTCFLQEPDRCGPS